MKNFHIPATHLTPTLSEAINLQGEGVYIVYGVFIYNNSLSINKLHKGMFSEILAQVDEGDEGETSTTYLVPVPEFIANEKDSEFAKYIQIHFVKSEDLKTDEEMMQEFVKAFASKLANVDNEDVTNTAESIEVAANDNQNA